MSTETINQIVNLYNQGELTKPQLESAIEQYNAKIKGAGGEQPKPEPPKLKKALRHNVDTSQLANWTSVSHPSDRHMDRQQTSRMGLDIASAVTGVAQSIADAGSMAYNVSLPNIMSHALRGEAINPFEQRYEVPEVATDTRSKAIRAGFEWATPWGKMTKGDALIGLVAGLGQKIAGDTGELAGGIGATLASVINSLRGKSIPKTDFEIAKKYLTENSDNAELAIENLRQAVDRGELGTLAQLTKDKTHYNLQAGARKGSPFYHDIQDSMRSRELQQIGVVDESLGANIPYRAQEQISNVAQDKTDALTMALQRRQQQKSRMADADYETGTKQADLPVAQSEQKLDENLGSYTKQLSSEASQELSSNWISKRDQFKKDVEKKAWEKVDKAPVVVTEDVLQPAKEAIDGLTEIDREILKRDFKNVFDLTKVVGKTETVKPQEIQSIVSEIKALQRSDTVTDNGKRLIAKVGNALENSLKELTNGKAYETAISKTKERVERFELGKVGQELKKQKTDPAEAKTFGLRLIANAKQEKGATVAEIINRTDDDELIKGAEKYIETRAKADPEKFLKDYDELLNNFPNLKAKLKQTEQLKVDIPKQKEKSTILKQALKTKQAEVKSNLKKQGSKLKSTIANKQISQLAKSPEKFIDDALISNTASNLTDVQKQIGKVDGAQELLKQAVNERIQSKITTAKDGKRIIKSSDLGSFIAMRDNLVDSKMISKAEADKIESVLRDVTLDFEARGKSLQPIETSEKAESAMKELFVSGISIATLQAMPNASNQLLLAGTVRRVSRIMLNKIGKNTLGINDFDRAKVLAVEKLIANPSDLLKELPKDTPPDKYQKFIENYLGKSAKAINQMFNQNEEDED